MIFSPDISPTHFATCKKYLSRNYLRNESWNSYSFFICEIEFYRYFDMWSPVARLWKSRFLYRQHRDHFLSIISSSIPAVNIGIPPSISQFRWHLCLVPSTFYDINVVFCISLIAISLYGKRWNVLMNWAIITRRYKVEMSVGVTKKLKNKRNDVAMNPITNTPLIFKKSFKLQICSCRSESKHDLVIKIQHHLPF
jgi:hypothetical protein